MQLLNNRLTDYDSIILQPGMPPCELWKSEKSSENSVKSGKKYEKCVKKAENYTIVVL